MTVFRMDIGPIVEQQLHCLPVAFKRGSQEGIAILSAPSVDLGALVKQ